MKLEIHDLCFSYRKNQVLKGVDLTVGNGSFCAILGPNGAGKSTLIKCINKIISPSGGTILADGKDILAMKQTERASIIGYVPQTTSVRPGLNVIETVMSGRIPQLHKDHKNENVQKVEDVLGRLGLEKFAFRPVSQLSGGERQRVLIARALAQEPRILLLDEPISNLDLRYQLEIMHLLYNLCKEQNITVLAIIHDLNMALQYADHAVLLDGGQIYAEGTCSDVITEENVGSVFKVDITVLQTNGISVIVPQNRYANQLN